MNKYGNNNRHHGGYDRGFHRSKRPDHSRDYSLSFKLDSHELGAPSHKERGVLIYTRIGEKGERKINNDNLIDRKSQILTEKENLEEKEGLNEENEIEEESDEEEMECLNWGKGRYFGTFFCRRCKEEGHFESNCTKLIDNYSCLFCLGQHTADACSSVVCFKCFSQGHKIRNCPSGGGHRPCDNCEKKHKSDCGIMIYSGSSLRREIDSVSCFYCGGKGHINCFKNFSPDNVFSN